MSPVAAFLCLLRVEVKPKHFFRSQVKHWDTAAAITAWIMPTVEAVCPYNLFTYIPAQTGEHPSQVKSSQDHFHLLHLVMYCF